jgi:TonB-linked SusC/RagA family outer membrane protein
MAFRVASAFGGSATLALLAAAMTVLPATHVAAQTGRVEGSVSQRETADPIPAARISIVGTLLFSISDQNGHYSIDSVPAGVYDVRVHVVGFQSAVITNQQVNAGLSTLVDFPLTPSILRLEGVVVTGVAERTQAVKLPFTVGQVSDDEIPVPGQTPEETLRGKVAGVTIVSGGGEPGSGVSVLLRGATSINTTGRTDAPLYVVDGVILGESTVDVDALDIEDIEVVKGAAAAALYGSRAANGVISIHTKRGDEVRRGESSILFRSEVGRNQLQRNYPVPQSHYFMQNENGEWLRDSTLADGSVVRVPTTRVDREVDYMRDSTLLLPGSDPKCSPAPGDTDCWTKWSYAVSDNTNTTYDNLALFFDPGTFYTNSLSVSHRSASTNLRASAYTTKESGVIEGLDGYRRRGVRLNVDHRIGTNFDFGANGYFSQSVSDAVSGAELPFEAIQLAAPDIRLDSLNANPRDSCDFAGSTDAAENPLYSVCNSDLERRRSRLLGGMLLRWWPLGVLDFEANVSVDRADLHTTQYYFKGYRTFQPSDPRADGMLLKDNVLEQALNAGLSATLSERFGPLATTVKARVLAERSELEVLSAEASDFAVTAVKNPSAGNPELDVVSGSSSKIRSLGYFLSTNLDLEDRYIADLLLRRDGSSLFGRDERWHTYYRVAAAYRMSLEPWWPFPFLNEFKLRYSRGTAGGRPAFPAQYETFDVQGQLITKSTLGNRNLRPERATEDEFGLDAIAFGSLSLTVAHARAKTEDQLLLVPLVSYKGFLDQWQNAGTLQSNTWEGSLQWSAIQRDDVGWDVNFVIDRTRTRITQLNVPPYEVSYGFYIKEGEELGSLWGTQWATKCGEILTPSGLGAEGVCENFELNDDGYLVPVGIGNHYTDGIDRNLYGSTITIDDTVFAWGFPVPAHRVLADTLADGGIVVDTTDYLRLGNTFPTFRAGLSNTIRFKGFSVYALFDAQVGADIYNRVRWLGLYYDETQLGAVELDQAGKAENHKKPTAYYRRLASIGVSSHFMEDATFVKFRELAVRYTFGREALDGILGGIFKRVSLAIIGRNIHTWTSYSGYDPETSTVGDLSRAIYRVDDYGYPNMRTWTGSVEIEF